MKPGASYVTKRRKVTFWPETGNAYSPKDGVRVIKLSLKGDEWLDPSTCKFFFDITNNTTLATENSLAPLTPGVWAFFRRLRVIVHGQVLEDIDNYNRVHEMFHIMKPTEKRLNDHVEGFGTSSSLNITLDAADSAQLLAKDATRTVCFTPMCSLFRQEKYLPLRYMPIQLELELVGNGAEVAQGSISALTPPAKSEDFLINNVQLKCDLCELDNTLDNEYTKFLIEGKDLPIHFTSISCSSQVIYNMNSHVTVSRSLTRVKAVFVSFSHYDASNPSPTRKEVNQYWHPMGTTYNHDEEIEFQLQINSSLYPEYPIRSLCEAFYQLRKTLGIHFSNDQMNLVQRYYSDHKFVMGIDLEKVLGASFTGANLSTGANIILKTKSANADIAFEGNDTYKMFVVLVNDSIVDVGLTGVRVKE